MFIYYIIVLGIIIITTVLMLYISGINKRLGTLMLIAIAISSIIISLLFPEIYRLTSPGSGGMAGTIIISIILIIALSIVLLYFIPGKKIQTEAFEANEEDIGDIQTMIGFDKTEDRENTEIENESNYLEQIYNNFVAEKERNTEEKMTAALIGENNAENSVDSVKNTDKMVLEVKDATTINDCINEAFRLKEIGDFEGAMLCYMEVLDRKPEKHLVFWVVLDMCVLYKTIGQIELAEDILTSYLNEYGNYMNEDIIYEIRRNLV